MDESSEYKCDNCQKTFAKKDQKKYAGHLTNCGKLNYRCSICNCKFRNQESLGLHLSKHQFFMSIRRIFENIETSENKDFWRGPISVIQDTS